MQYKYCMHCGRKIKKSSRFCTYCGFKQPAQTIPQSNSQDSNPQSSSSKENISNNNQSNRSIKTNSHPSNSQSNDSKQDAVPHMSRVEMHEKQNQGSNQDFNIDRYKNKVNDYKHHVKSGFNNYLYKRGYNGNNMGDVVKSLWKPFKQHNIFLIYPAVIAIFYLIEFMLAVDTATGGNVQMDLSNSVMTTFPMSSRFAVIFMGSIPAIISIVLACLPWFWTQVVAILPFLFGTSSVISATRGAGSNALFNFALVVMVALLIYSRLDSRTLYGSNYQTYLNIKKWLTIGFLVLAGILFIVSLKAFYLLIKPELFGTTAVIIIILACGIFPSIKFGWLDVLGNFHQYF